MKKVFLLVLFVAPAWATDKPKYQDQYQEQFQIQNTEQNNQMTLAFPDPENDITLRNTAPAIAPNIYPAGNCYMAWSGGLSVPGFAASGGKAVLDDGCRKLEWVRMAYQVGMRDAAIHALCSMPEAADVPQCGSTQDYNREMKLLELDNDELVNQIEKLKKDRAALLEERQHLIDQHKYDMDKCEGRCTK